MASLGLCAQADANTGRLVSFARSGTATHWLMVVSLRYLDTFVKLDGSWLFSERLLYVDWLEERALYDL